MIVEREYSKQITNSQMGKVKFFRRPNVGSKQAGVDFSFVVMYHPKADFQSCFYLKNSCALPVISCACKSNFFARRRLKISYPQ